MDIKKLIEQPKWWAEECDRTNFGYQAKKTLRDAAITLLKLKIENNRLRAELQKSEHDNVNLTGELAKVAAELEQVKRERDAAIKRLRKIDWCAGCKDFCGLDGCAGVGMENCTVENDHYQFGPEEG